MELLTDYDHIAVFDADFKPDPDFLVSGSFGLLVWMHGVFLHSLQLVRDKGLPQWRFCHFPDTALRLSCQLPQFQAVA